MSADHQNQILAALPGKTCLTTEEIVRATSLASKQVTQAIGKLVSRSFVDRVERGCFQLSPEGHAFLASGAKIDCAPLRPCSSPIDGAPVEADDLPARTWRAILASGHKFSVADLAELAVRHEATGEDEIRRYCAALCRAGILKRFNGREARYLLIKDIGPKAPRFSRRRQVVYDPNTREVLPCS